MELMLVDRLKEVFFYNPITGGFTNRVYRSANAQAGQVAGCVNKHGYTVIRFQDKLYYAHRLAWLYVYGSEPPQGMDLDHINGDKTDNRIDNLRLATRSQNMCNRGLPRHNTTGVKGLKFNRKQNNWAAWIKVDGRIKSLGCYADKETASRVRHEAEALHHKQFRRSV